MKDFPPFPVVTGEFLGIPIIADPRVTGIRLIRLDACPDLLREVERWRWYRKNLAKKG